MPKSVQDWEKSFSYGGDRKGKNQEEVLPLDRSEDRAKQSPAGKAVSSQNVIVGLRNRKKALEQAKQELITALAKVRRLARWHKQV